MSVFMMLQVNGEAGRLQGVMEGNADRWKAINARAKENGAIHHRFLASGDGTSIAVFDEWESMEGFQKFFASSPEIPQLMAEAGVTSEPQVTFWHPVDTPDAF
jgi:heme-degrading monooxygenase HmoA